MQCIVCGRRYQHTSSLNRHRRDRHAPDPGIPRRYCDLCREFIPENDWGKHSDTDCHRDKRQRLENAQLQVVQQLPAATIVDDESADETRADSEPEMGFESEADPESESDSESELSSELESEASSDVGSSASERPQNAPIIYVNSHRNEPIDVAAYLKVDIDETVFTRIPDTQPTVRGLPGGPRAAVPAASQPGADKLIAHIHDMVVELQVEGRDRRGKLLHCLQSILLEVCRPDRRQDVEFATPATWRTFDHRHRQCTQAKSANQVFEHILNVEGLGQPQRTLTLCTADPIPALLEILAKHYDQAYFGRGEILDHVDTSRPWTFPLWREIAANVPADGLPLMVSAYSDGCSVAGASYHPIILEPAHFCSTKLHTLDLMVTASMFKDPKVLTGTARSSHQKALKLQIFNLALDATLSWFHEAMVDGINVKIGGNTVKLYPRIFTYDGDQLELVALIGKTCYLCEARAGTFGDLQSVCGREHPPLTVDTLKRLRYRAFHGEKTAVAALGMRHPGVNYRTWSAAHAPLIDPEVGGIARLTRADDLHINVLGTVKKIYENLSTLLGLEGVAVLNKGFCDVEISATALQLQRFSAGPWSLTNVRGSDLMNFIWQCPEVLLRQRLSLLDLGFPPAMLADVLQAVVLAREVLVITHTQHRFGEQEVEELQSVILLLRRSLVKVFSPVRSLWKYPKFHTMSAFITQLPDRGIGSTYRGEAKHRYLKQNAIHTSRRERDTIGLFKKVLANEERGRSLSRRETKQQRGILRCIHKGGVARALTEQSVLEQLRQHIAPQHADNVARQARELYQTLLAPGHVIVDAFNLSGKAVIRAGYFVIVRGAVARVLLMARPSENNDVQVLLQQYETAGRRNGRCALLESRPFGIVCIEPEDAFVQFSFNQISKIAHVFSIPADDDVEEDMLVRDTAYEKAQPQVT